MTTTSNTNFSVEAIVAKYRNYVAAHTPKVEQYLEGVGVEEFAADVEDSSSDGQLLITLYNGVAGNNADKRVQRILSKYADHFYKDALDSEEYAFLQNHFKEMVAYIFANKEGGIIYNVFPYQSLENDESISKFVDSCNNTIGGNVFLFGPLEMVSDIAVRLSNCNVFYGIDHCHLEAWAFVLIRFYAFGIKYHHIRFGHNHNVINTITFDNVIVYDSPLSWSWHLLIHKRDSYVQKYWDTFSNPEMRLYSQLKDNGKMFINTSMESLYGEGYKSFKEQLVIDKSLASVTMHEHRTLFGKTISTFDLIIDKSSSDYVTMNNFDGETCKVEHKAIDTEILLPSFYLTEKRSEGKLLSDIVDFALPIMSEDIMWDQYRKGKVFIDNEELPNQDIKVISSTDLSETYCNAEINIDDLKDRSYYRNMYREMLDTNPSVDRGNFKLPLQWEFRGPIVILKAIDNVMKIGYVKNDEQVFDITDDRTLISISPKTGYDVQYVTALFLTKEVSSVLLSICNGTIGAKLMGVLMNKIYAPDHSELDRYKVVSNANYAALQQLQEEQKQMHAHYVKGLRMRKHALSQSLSSMRFMFSALNTYRERQGGSISDNEQISRVSDITVRDAFEFLARKFKEVGPAIDQIANEENSFGNFEWIDPEDYIETYISKNRNSWLNFKAINSWHISNDSVVVGNHLLREKGEYRFYFPVKAIERIFDNIVANAKSHGFTDKNKMDYILLFSWRIKGDSIVVEVANNGTPIPNDMNTVSLLEYGVSSSLHQNGHNGIGCYEIAAIMREYGGNVRVISCPEEEYSVRYELTFNIVIKNDK